MRTKSKLSIPRLVSGGFITNYSCPSQCAHCLYNCSPKRDKAYISAEMAEALLVKALELGCRSVHLGGGEPFLKPDRLLDTVDAARRVGMGIDYVETNSAWFKDEISAVDLLEKLRRAGVGTLLLSISPYHNEHIPFAKVEGVVAACGKAGISIFPWIAEFAGEVGRFDKNSTHSLDEFRDAFGEAYLERLPARYSVILRGRALETARSIAPHIPLDDILRGSRGGCAELEDTFHFHLDLYGSYIPGLCAGLAVRYKDLGHPLSPEQYPILTTLRSGGPAALLKWAKEKFGFKPANAYISKCDLCESIRHFLASGQDVDFPELAPKEFYSSTLKRRPD